MTPSIVERKVLPLDDPIFKDCLNKDNDPQILVKTDARLCISGEDSNLKDLLEKHPELRIESLKHGKDKKFIWSLVRTQRVGEFYEQGRLIREGGHASIYAGWDRRNGDRVVLKQMKPREGRTELRILGHLKECTKTVEPALIQLCDSVDDTTLVFQAMEDCTDLFDYIEENDFLDEIKVRRIFGQIARAVAFLHDQGIVHRDIKDENVIIERGSLQCKLIDLGSAAFYRKPMDCNCGSSDSHTIFSTFHGTLDYMPPELIDPKEITTFNAPAQDIYALGVLLYTIAFREVPFHSIEEIKRGKLERIPFKRPCLDLIRRMIVGDPEARPTIEDVLQDPWLEAPLG